MSSNQSSTLKFDLSEGIESAKLGLGYGGHALVPELLRPDPVDVGQLAYLLGRRR